MSEEEATEEAATEEEIEEEQEPETTDGQPSVEDDEQADLSGLGGVDPEEIEDAAGATAEEEDDQPDTDSEESDSTDVSASEGDAEMSPENSAGEWGEMYVSVCQTATNTIIKKKGDGTTIDADHFTETVPLDEYFNDVMEEMVGDSEMPPQQALVVGTMLAVGGPVAMHTELLEDVISNMDGGSLGGGAA